MICSLFHLCLVSSSGRWCLAATLTVVFATNTPAADPVRASFTNDVMAVLSKAGCNMGACHGNQNGKGGFKLSLRGQTPDEDWLALTRDQDGRRIDLVDPDDSLCLQKPLQQIAHEGGKRFAIDSLEYKILRDWISAGAQQDPDDTVQLVELEAMPSELVIVEPEIAAQLEAWATFSDGTRREVTQLAVYEPNNSSVTISPGGRVERLREGETTVLVRYLGLQVPVRLAFVPARKDYVWQGPDEVNRIDSLVFDKLRALRLNPAPVCNDQTFVRRSFLDALGVLPTAQEARQFVADDRNDKRPRLIDELLTRPEFATHWALKWSDLLRGEEKTLDRKGVQSLHHWLEESFAQNKPLDELAREIISARGSTYENPPTNFYRGSREPMARAESIAQVFLGVRLQCARCHNHPFDRWTQDDYYDWVTLFSRIDYKVLENNRRDQNDSHEFNGEQIVWSPRTGETKNPRTGQSAKPRFLGDSKPLVDAEFDRFDASAAWVTSPENPFFAAAQANRTWFHLVGRGIVEPIDDFRATNPAVNPQLLEYLAQTFVADGYDLRQLVRLIMNSHVYQLDSADEENAETAIANFAQATVRRLAAEPLLDALCQVLQAPARFNGYPVGLRAGEIPGVQAVRPRDRQPSDGDRFLKDFGKPPRLLTCECERSGETTLSQTFQLVSGPLLNELLTAPDNRLSRWLASAKSSDEVVEQLFWTALSRAPTDVESKDIATRLEAAGDRRCARRCRLVRAKLAGVFVEALTRN